MPAKTPALKDSRPSRSLSSGSADPVQLLASSGANNKESWLQQIHQFAGAGAWEVNFRADTFAASPELFELHGFEHPTEALEYKAWLERIHPDDRGAFENSLVHLLKAGGEVDLEYRVLPKIGDCRWVNARGRILRDATGRPSRALGITIDATERKRLEKEILHVTAREQKRVGYELNDEVSQQLTGILIKSNVLLDRLEEEGSGHTEYLGSIIELLRDVQVYTRDLSHTLTPVLVEVDTFYEALSQLAVKMNKLYDVPCVFYDRNCTYLPPNNEVATHLYRIVQEGMENAAQHANPNRIVVEFTDDDLSRTCLRVLDDGKGIEDLEQAREKGLGLRTMKYRANLIGASLYVRSQLGEGTVVECCLDV